MEEQYNIKLLNINDKILIKDLFVDVFTNEPWNDDWSNEDQLDKYLEDIIGNKNSLSIGLFSKNELLGISLGSIIHWYSGTEYYIRELCIKRTQQHQGIGTIFIKLIEDYLHKNNISSIILSTDIGTPAYDFYTKNNFNELPKSRFFHKHIK
jgi:aminoglycoside 6'-N-acetyltransferase I